MCSECDRQIEEGEIQLMCKRCGQSVGLCCQRSHREMCLPTARE